MKLLLFITLFTGCLFGQASGLGPIIQPVPKDCTTGGNDAVGAINSDGTLNCVNITAVGVAGASLFSATASATVTQTSATSLIGTVVGNTTIPANTFIAGQFLLFFAEGYYSTPATPTSLTIDLKLGGTTRVTTGAIVQIASVTNGTWRVFCGITTRTTGASGTQIANCTFEGTGATITPGQSPMQASSTWTIDTTATKVFDLQATWSTATGAPTITCTNVAAWIPGAPVTSVFGQTGAVGAVGDIGATGVVAQMNGTNFTVNSSGVPTKIGGVTTAGLGVPVMVGQSVITNSSATSLVNLLTSATAGNYEIRYSFDLHTACTTGSESLSLALNWTGNSARQESTGGMVIGTAQAMSSLLTGVQPAYVVSGNISYTPSLTGVCASGTAAWDGLVQLWRLQ